jgi:hypothetical protein
MLFRSAAFRGARRAGEAEMTKLKLKLAALALVPMMALGAGALAADSTPAGSASTQLQQCCIIYLNGRYYCVPCG